MQFNKNHTHIIISIGIVFVGILIASGVWMASKNKKPLELSYEEKFPMLRTLDFGSEFHGTSTPIGGGWSLYKNDTLGFSVEYPSERVPRENSSIRDMFGRSYTIYFSGGEFEVIAVTITPSRFHTIEDWVKNDPEYQKPNYVLIRRKISGLNAVTTYYVPEFPPITDEQILRRTYVIKNDIMYTIDTRDIPSEKYERIWSSFQFLRELR